MKDQELKASAVFFHTLAKTQTLPRDAIISYQLKLLEKLARHAMRHVPFYRESGRLEPLFRKDGSFDMTRWTEVAPLGRGEARDNQDRLLADVVPADMQPCSVDLTSGTSGTPLRITQTLLSRVASRALLGRAISWHDGMAEQRVLTIKSSPGGQSVRISPSALIVPADLPPAEQIEAIGDFRPTHVVSYPNVLANVLQTSQAALAGLRVAVVSGEQLTPRLRATLNSLTGARLINCYGATEVGAVAYEDTLGQLRVCEESVFVEQGAEGPDGLTTALLTPFYSFAMPLIRYAPGDVIGQLSHVDDNLRGLRVLERIGGRERNLLRSPDGHLFFADIRAKDLSSILEYRDWQMRQVSRTQAVFKIETPTLPDDGQKRALSNLLVKILHGLSVRIEYVDKLAKHPNGKFENVTRDLAVDEPVDGTGSLI